MNIAELIRRLAARAQSGLQVLDVTMVRAVVRQAVHSICTALPPSPSDPPADPTVAALRRFVATRVERVRTTPCARPLWRSALGASKGR